MSMLSAQVDKLRKAAQTCRDLGRYETEQMMLDAADTIWELRDDLQQTNAENAKLRSLCEMLLETYRLGAVTGEGADKFWCREMYDRGMRMLRELGVEADE